MSRRDEPEGDRKECVCVILKPDKVVSNLLPVLNVTSHLQDRFVSLNDTYLVFFSFLQIFSYIRH